MSTDKETAEQRLKLEKRILVIKDFEHKTLKVTEIITDDGRLIWCRWPWNQRVVNGAPNPLVHTSFGGVPTTAFATEEEARERVKEEFEKHYNLV